jgi:hypothetical protein
MSPSARGQYVKRMQVLYREAEGRRAKSRLLDQVSETLGRGRRQAKRLMRGKEPRLERPFRRREPVYPPRLIEILASAWEATQYLWSVRLKAALPLWMSWIKKRWSLSAEEERLLLAMSPATMDRRLAAHKRKLGRQIYGQTKPGRWLRQTIPIQTESWNVPEPGWVEADTVSHAGPSSSGLFAVTLNQVDLFSGWVEMRAILGKSAVAVVAATKEMRQELPFELKGMDTDNGDEFINYELDRYCRKTEVKRFRSRPYKKDDQAHIEQKNGTHVRRLIGWDRYDSAEAVDAMNGLYCNEWRHLANLFLPSVKLTNKIRVGSKIKRVYEEAKTPLDRLLTSEHGDRARLEQLRRLRGRTDPFELSRALDRKLQAVWKLASRGPIKPAPTAYKPQRLRWHDMVRQDNLPEELFPADRSAVFQIRKAHFKDGFFGTD